MVGGVKEVKEAFQAACNVRKRHQNGQFSALFALKIIENAIFWLKLLNKIYSQDVF
jgi:hypothetical protein